MISAGKQKQFYQTTERPSDWVFTWSNACDFQQDVFLVCMEADELEDLGTTTSCNQPLHPWFQNRVAFTEKNRDTGPSTNVCRTSIPFHQRTVHDLVLQFQVNAFHVQEAGGQAPKDYL